MKEIIIDSFAGGGGASLGIEMALGRSPDVAINHDADALVRANYRPDEVDEPLDDREIGPLFLEAAE